MKFAATILPLLCSSISAVDNEVTTATRRLQEATYAPGDFSEGIKIEEAGDGRTLYLSNGLQAKMIGSEGKPVTAADGTQFAVYHKNADGGETFPIEGGGYYYVSNSEHGSEYPAEFDVIATDRRTLEANLTGGVYAFEFNEAHELVGYKQLLNLTTYNCAGGKTPWGSWISCEERRMWGQCWQVDPAGVIPPRPTKVTGPLGVAAYGAWEAFAWDDDHKVAYVTNDDSPAEGLPATRGANVRFTPDATALACLDAATSADRWCALDSGSHEFLKLDPETMAFEWVSNITEANPGIYRGSEGVHYEDGILTFAAALEHTIFELDVVAGTYKATPAPFPQEPDNIRILNGVLYVCTDGDHEPDDGLWGIDSQGAFRVFKEEGHNYPSGVAFSPDNMMMYVSMFGEATYQISRVDGKSFADETAAIKYEEAAAPAPVPTSGGANPSPTAGAPAPPPTGSGSVNGHDWSMAMIMMACVVAAGVPAFAMS